MHAFIIYRQSTQDTTVTVEQWGTEAGGRYIWTVELIDGRSETGFATSLASAVDLATRAGVWMPAKAA